MQNLSSAVVEVDPCPNIDPKAAKYFGLLADTCRAVADVSARQRE